jgi:hypothetical protein
MSKGGFELCSIQGASAIERCLRIGIAKMCEGVRMEQGVSFNEQSSEKVQYLIFLNDFSWKNGSLSPLSYRI